MKCNSHRLIPAIAISIIIIGFVTACAKNAPVITIQPTDIAFLSTPSPPPTIFPTPTLTITPQPTSTITVTLSRTPTLQPDEIIKVMTYNLLVGGLVGIDEDFTEDHLPQLFDFIARSDPSTILKGEPFDGYTNRLPRILDIVKQVSPDILGVQEAWGWQFNDEAIPKAVADELNMNYFFGKADNPGIALFTKFEIVSGEVYQGLFNFRGDRPAIHVELVTDQGHTLHVFVIHTKNNEIEIPKLLDISEPYIAENTILMGDFNAGFDYLLDLGFRDAGWKRVATDTRYGSTDLGIDHIWVAPSLAGFARQKFGDVSYTSDDVFSASDHNPVVAEIGLYPP